MIKPRTSRKYPKTTPADVFPNPVGKEFFKAHIASKGAPEKIIDIATITATNTAKKRIMVTIKTPFGLFSIFRSTSRFCSLATLEN
ncbi:MAG TPA: hypothetical protein VEF35_04795 [Candidatus Bathyarchaeia archaeon]|nr:hypothetical protein [Candidatus Bathyarchaeia archaeon]